MFVFKFIKYEQVFAVALLFIIPIASAGDIEKIFDSVSTVSSGSKSFSTQRYNGVSGGGFSARNSLVTNKAIKFRPPSFSAGCGGIDFFAGSFSIINKDQIVQTMRGIAQGAATYAFGIAVKSLCPSCADEMKNIQEKLEKFNDMTMSSCESMAGWMDDETASWQKKNHALDDVVSSPLKRLNGLIPDAGDAKSNPDKDPAKALAEAGLASEAGLESNIVWQSIKELDIGGRLASVTGMDEKEAGEMMLNLIGTKIQYVNNDGDDSKSSQETNDSVVFTLTLQSFLRGTQSDVYYTCDTEDKCLEPTVSPPPADIKKGLVDVISAKLYSPGDSDSLLIKIQERRLCLGQEVSCPEADLLGMASFPALQLIEKSPKDDSTRNDLAFLIANDIALGTVEAMYELLMNVFYEMGQVTKSKGAEKLLMLDFKRLVTSANERLRQGVLDNRVLLKDSKKVFATRLDALMKAYALREKVRADLSMNGGR